MIYESISSYLQSETELQAKVTMIRALIDDMFAKYTDVVANADMQDYMLNTGQTTIRQTFRSPKAFMDAITALQAQEQYYLNKLVGRVSRGVGIENVRFRTS